MKLLRKLFGRMTAEDYHYQQVELIYKAARRCAHDLAHAASYIQQKEEQQEFHARAQMWLQTFYLDGSGKNYRHRLHTEINELSAYADRLEARLEENGLSYSDLDDPRMPF